MMQHKTFTVRPFINANTDWMVPGVKDLRIQLWVYPTRDPKTMAVRRGSQVSIISTLAYYGIITVDSELTTDQLMKHAFEIAVELIEDYDMGYSYDRIRVSWEVGLLIFDSLLRRLEGHGYKVKSAPEEIATSLNWRARMHRKILANG